MLVLELFLKTLQAWESNFIKGAQATCVEIASDLKKML